MTTIYSFVAGAMPSKQGISFSTACWAYLSDDEFDEGVLLGFEIQHAEIIMRLITVVGHAFLNAHVWLTPSFLMVNCSLTSSSLIVAGWK